MAWPCWRERRFAGRAGPPGSGCSILAIGWTQQDNYLRDRYTSGFRFHLVSAFRWANGVSDARIGVGGTSGAFQQYGLYGRDVSNHVQYVGRPGADGDFSQIDNCPEWRRQVNDGDYDYLVTTPGLDLNNPAGAYPRPKAPGPAPTPPPSRIIRDSRIEIFQVEGQLNPANCPKPK